jgi:hypothetical protein
METFQIRVCDLAQWNTQLVPHPVFSSQSAGSADLMEILLTSHRVALHDFMALSYGPARALA